MEPRDITGRPLFVFCGVFFAASVLMAAYDSRIKLITAAVCAAPLTVLIIVRFLTKRRNPVMKFFAVALCAVLIASFPSYLLSARRESAEMYDGVTATVSMAVREVSYSSSYYGYVTADAEFPDGKTRRISVGIPDGSCAAGDVLEGPVTFHRLSGDDDYLLADGIFLTGESEGMVRIGSSEKFSLSSFFSRINKKLSARFYVNADDGAAALSAAVLLGDRSGLEPSVRRDFSRLGISHLLAISGLHLSVLITSLDFLLSTLGVGKRRRCAVLLPVIPIYMALTGFSASVARAGIMHIMRVIGTLAGRKSDGLTALGVSAALIAAVDPYSVFDARLWLSVLATFACVIYASLTAGRAKCKKFFRRAARAALDTVRLTLLITVFTLPVSWKIFGSLSIVSPVTNMVFIPLLTLYLYLSVIFLLLTFFPILAYPTSYVLAYASQALTSLASEVSHLRGIVVSLNYPAAGIFTAILLICVIGTVFSGARRKRIGYICSGLAAAALTVCLTVGTVMQGRTSGILFINKNKNDGFVLRSGHTYTVVDVSSGSSAFISKLIGEAEADRAVEIETFVLTHYHANHVSSVGKVVGRNIVRQILLPVPETENDLSVCDSLVQICRKAGTEIRFYEREDGKNANTGNVVLRFYDYSILSRSTHPIVCFSAKVGEENMTYLGSSFSEGSAGAVTDASDADVVFFGAHPPVSKAAPEISVKGNAILTDEAYGFMSDFAFRVDGDTVILPPDGGKYKTETGT